MAVKLFLGFMDLSSLCIIVINLVAFFEKLVKVADKGSYFHGLTDDIRHASIQETIKRNIKKISGNLLSWVEIWLGIGRHEKNHIWI